MKATVNLYVFAVFPDGQIVKVGRILSQNLDTYGRYEGFFRYADAYLEHPFAYAIDPVNLPLENGTFSAENYNFGIHLVFDDSLPDSWGRQLLGRKGGLETARFAPAHLLSVLGGGGLGRFLFNEQDRVPRHADTAIPFADISRAIDEAGKLEDSLDIETAELRHLLACGSSAGGARPKVLTSRDGHNWLAKFTSRKDVHPDLMVALEEAGMTLAAMAGLDVPELQRAEAGDRDILLIKRFDVVNNEGRNAIISFRTLLNSEDPYPAHYSDMAGIIRLYSDQSVIDLEHLFRQMVINILLVNTDDHLQNFAMLHTRQGWRLSPAYDIVPNIYQTGQILQVNGKHSEITSEDILREGKNFGLSLQKSKKILQDVLKRTSNWRKIFHRCRVPESHTGRLRAEIARRYGALSTS